MRLLDHQISTTAAERRLPEMTDVASYASKGDHAANMALPEWDEGFAHLLGWLVGDGSFSGDVISAVYGSDEDRSAILPRHMQWFTGPNGGRAPKISEQANGTAQLRLSRWALAGFFQALGLKPVKAAEKDVPWSVFEAPTEAITAFLRGLFDADGTVVDQAMGQERRHAGLGSRSASLLRSVQQPLASLGISEQDLRQWWQGPSGFVYTTRDGVERSYDSSPGYDLRIAGEGIDRFASSSGSTRLARPAGPRSSPRQASTTRHGPPRCSAVRMTYWRSLTTSPSPRTTRTLSKPRNRLELLRSICIWTIQLAIWRV